MKIEDIILRPFDDVEVGSIVKPNIFIEWGDETEILIDNPIGNDLWMGHDMTEDDEELSVLKVYQNMIQTTTYRYPRDMVLVKGVDYE
jgi:hypothetical protein